MNLHHLSDGDLYLRRCEKEDAPLIYMLENDPILEHSNTLIEPLSHFQARQVASVGDSELLSNGFLLLIPEIRFKGSQYRPKALGLVQLYNFDFVNRRAAIGIVLRPECHGKGYGSRILAMMLSYAFKALSLHQVYAEIYPSNVIALHCFKRLGFEIIAQLPEWYKTDEGYEDLNILLYKPKSNT